MLAIRSLVAHPVFSTATATFADGTITSNGQAVACYASTNPSTDCPITDPFGPPNVTNSASLSPGTEQYPAPLAGFREAPARIRTQSLYCFIQRASCGCSAARIDDRLRWLFTATPSTKRNFAEGYPHARCRPYERARSAHCLFPERCAKDRRQNIGIVALYMRDRGAGQEGQCLCSGCLDLALIRLPSGQPTAGLN